MYKFQLNLKLNVSNYNRFAVSSLQMSDFMKVFTCFNFKLFFNKPWGPTHTKLENVVELVCGLNYDEEKKII